MNAALRRIRKRERLIRSAWTAVGSALYAAFLIALFTVTP